MRVKTISLTSNSVLVKQPKDYLTNINNFLYAFCFARCLLMLIKLYHILQTHYMRFISELRYHLFRIPDQDTTKMKSARVLSKRNTFASMQTNI